MKRVLFLLAFVVIGSSAIYAQSSNVGIGTSTPGSKLTVNGSFAAQFRSETNASAPIGANDHYIAYHGTANGTLTLPPAISGTGNFKGRQYIIKNSSAANTLTITAASGELIDNTTNVASITINAGFTVVLESTGATSGVTWEVVLISQPTIANDATRYVGGSIAAIWNTPSGATSTSSNPQAVSPIGGITATAGSGYTVNNPSNGIFIITFSQPFTQIYGATANIYDCYLNGNPNPDFSYDGNSLQVTDNTQISFLNNNTMTIKTGNGGGNLNNVSFTFTVSGK